MDRVLRVQGIGVQGARVGSRESFEELCTVQEPQGWPPSKISHGCHAELEALIVCSFEAVSMTIKKKSATHKQFERDLGHAYVSLRLLIAVPFADSVAVR